MLNVDRAQHQYYAVVIGSPVNTRWGLLKALLDGKCEDPRWPQAGDARFPHHVIVDDENVQLVFFWCWPSEKYMEVSCQYQLVWKHTMVAIVNYDRQDTGSFESARKHLNGIRTRSKSPDVPTLLVECEMNVGDERRVSEDDGRALADEFSCRFFQVSVPTGKGIAELMTEIAVQARIRRRAVEEREEAEQRAKAETTPEKSQKSCTVQ